MLAEELVALAAAHGIDLTHVGGSASKTDGDARKRRRHRAEVDLGIDVPETASGRHSRVYRRPSWSLQELGLAARDVPRVPWLAARYSIAGDTKCYWELWYALVFEAQRIGRREGWAPRVKGADGSPRLYMQELAMLVLDEDAHRRYFAIAPDLYSIYLQVSPTTWNRILAPRYARLQHRYEAWLGTARAMIQSWIDPPEPHEERAKA